MDRILNWVKKKKFELSMFFITIIAFYMRFALFNKVSDDYRIFLENWFYEIKNNSGIFALKNDLDNCDYNFPYLMILSILTYLPIHPLISIKIVSITFDFILAIASMILVSKLVDKNKKIYKIVAYGTVLLLPSGILNSAYWGQCDAIYTSFIIISLIMLVDKKYFRACLFLGIAFSFKLQFVFILPLFALVFLTDKKLMKKLHYFLVVPMMNIILSLPVIIMRKDILCVFKPYFGQLGEYNNLISANFPNIYNLICRSETYNYLVQTPNPILPKVMMGILVIIYLAILISFIKCNIKIENKNMILIATWTVVLSTFLLPYMHDRYLYLGDFFSVILFLISDNVGRKKYIDLLIPIGLQICSVFAYVVYLSNYQVFFIDKRIISILNLVVLVLLTIKVVKMCRNSYLKESNITQI